MNEITIQLTGDLTLPDGAVPVLGESGTLDHVLLADGVKAYLGLSVLSDEHFPIEGLSLDGCRVVFDRL